MTTTSAGLGTEAREQLAAALRGDLITPGDPGYDDARAVYNAMIDKYPAAIARCRDAADVVACVNFARDRGIEIAVRGGGHNAAGFGVSDDALVIDLSLLRSTTVDPAAHTVRVDAGCTWGDVDHATVAFGMATPSGFLASTGVGGLTLGGGIGYLSRRFGLTVDSLLAADVVLADGTLVTASDSEHSDLFWALRGGGGNFGVVTSFTFRCHDIGEAGTIIGGPVLYDLADAPAVMRWYREVLPALPEELSGWIGLLTIPPAPPFPEELWGRPACGIVWCYTGPHDRAAEVLEPVTSFGSPLLVGVQPMPFSVLQSAFDALYPAGLQWYWRADFFNEISDAAIAVHRKYGDMLPTGHSTMHMYPVDGAASRVPADATAFAYRDGGWAGVIVGVDPDPASAERITQWAKDYWQELHPHSAGGAYVNFMGDEGQDRIKAAYRGNYDRLAQVKQRYDPDNVFHVNQNIQPAAAAAAR
jgi:FAD/FMN-containing dehydrogenase